MRTWRLSPQIDDAVQRLWALDRPAPRPGIVRRLLGAHAPGPSAEAGALADALVVAIADAGETEAIYPLASLALQPKLRGSEAAARAIDALLARTPASALPQMDERCRSALTVYGSPDPNLKPADAVRFAESGVAAFARVVLASFHPSGYVREESVKLLGARFGARAVPYLLLRANDWVEPVRSRAVAACRGMLSAEHACAFVNGVVLVLRLERCFRGGGTSKKSAQAALAGEVRAFLLDEGRAALQRGCASEREDVRRACFRLRFEADEAEAGKAVREALAGRSPFVRVQAARRLRSLDPALLRELVPSMRVDGCVAVRLEALRAGGEARSAEGRQFLEQALCDRSAAVRFAARFFLKRIESFDFAAFYRARIAANERPLPAALLGMGETGTEDDVQSLLALFAHPDGRVRASAAAAAARLAPDAAYEALCAALFDPHPSVSRRAAEALMRMRRAETAERIERLLDAPPSEHAARNALRVLKEVSKWQRLHACLRALRSPADFVRVEAERQLAQWLAAYTRTATSPTRGELERVRGELAASEGLLEARVAEQLRFVTEGWRV